MKSLKRLSELPITIDILLVSCFVVPFLAFGKLVLLRRGKELILRMRTWLFTGQQYRVTTAWWFFLLWHSILWVIRMGLNLPCCDGSVLITNGKAQTDPAKYAQRKMFYCTKYILLSHNCTLNKSPFRLHSAKIGLFVLGLACCMNSAVN